LQRQGRGKHGDNLCGGSNRSLKNIPDQRHQPTCSCGGYYATAAICRITRRVAAASCWKKMRYRTSNSPTSEIEPLAYAKGRRIFHASVDCRRDLTSPPSRRWTLWLSSESTQAIPTNFRIVAQRGGRLPRRRTYRFQAIHSQCVRVPKSRHGHEETSRRSRRGQAK